MLAFSLYNQIAGYVSLDYTFQDNAIKSCLENLKL